MATYTSLHIVKNHSQGDAATDGCSKLVRLTLRFIRNNRIGRVGSIA